MSVEFSYVALYASFYLTDSCYVLWSKCHTVLLICGDMSAGHGTEYGWQNQLITEEEQSRGYNKI